MTYNQLIRQPELFTRSRSALRAEFIFRRIDIVRQNIAALFEELLRSHVYPGFFAAFDEIRGIFFEPALHDALIYVRSKSLNAAS